MTILNLGLDKVFDQAETLAKNSKRAEGGPPPFSNLLFQPVTMTFF